MSLSYQKIQDIRNFIKKDELGKAIALLSGILRDSPELDDIILQSARRYRLEKEIRSGLLTREGAAVTRNELVKALLEICRELEKELKEESAEPVESENGVRHFLQDYPRGPMVEGHLIDEAIVEAYARLIRPEQAINYINKANQLRKKADPNDSKVTIIEPYTLLSPGSSRPIDFWLDAFHEARLHGPRMLAALLFALPDDQFPETTKTERIKLLDILKKH